LEGEELKANLQELRAELQELVAPTCYEDIAQPRSIKEWWKMEKNRAFGYNGHSKRTQQRRDKEAREGQALRAKARAS